MQRGSSHFFATPVDFDRFVSLARSHSRSLSPDHELQQMLWPFQERPADKTDAVPGVQAKQGVSASPTYRSLPVNGRSSSTGDAEKCVRDSRVRGRSRGVSASSRAVALKEEPLRSPTTSTILSNLTGGPFELHSASIKIPEDSAHLLASDGEETQLLTHSPLLADDADPLLHATRQLSSPLYDPVTGKFLCWCLRPLETRPRAAYGDMEGVSCDFCGHTDWKEDTEDATVAAAGASALPTPPLKQEVSAAQEAFREATITTSLHGAVFHHCSTCQVDICDACLDEIRADERLHVPCLQCQWCGAFERRQDAPLHRCGSTECTPGAERMAKEDGARLAVPLCSTESKTVAAAQLSPKRGTSLRCKGTPLQASIRLGLSKNRTQHPQVPSACGETAEGLAERDSSAVAVAGKRSRSVSGRSSQIQVCVKKEALDDEGQLNNWNSRSPVHPQKVRRLARTRPEHRHLEANQPAANHESSIVPPSIADATSGLPNRYEVHVTPHTSDEVEAVHRIMGELLRTCPESPSIGVTTIWCFATRLAAETCMDRANLFALEALLTRRS